MARVRLRPQSAERHCGEALAEAERALACIEHDTGLEACAEPVAQVAQSREVFGACARGGLDLDTGYLTAAELQDDVDLALLLVAVGQLGNRT